MSFGDTSNSLHLYSSVAEPLLNPYARDSEFADPIEHLPPMDICDEFAIYSYTKLNRYYYFEIQKPDKGASIYLITLLQSKI